MIPILWLRQVQRNAPELSSNAVRVAAALAVRASRSGTCFPAMQTIADDLRIQRKTAGRGVQELRDKGWLIVVVRKSPKGRASNGYRLVSQAADPVDNSDSEEGGLGHEDSSVWVMRTHTHEGGMGPHDSRRSSPNEEGATDDPASVDNYLRAAGDSFGHRIPGHNSW